MWCFCFLFSSQPAHSILKRPKLASRPSSVRFDQVTVFSFPRCQGFTSVPSRGGATLGMVRRHSSLQRYTVSEHALEQRHRRRQRLRERRREERLEALKHKVSAFDFWTFAMPACRTAFLLCLLIPAAHEWGHRSAGGRRSHCGANPRWRHWQRHQWWRPGGQRFPSAILLQTTPSHAPSSRGQVHRQGGEKAASCLAAL